LAALNLQLEEGVHQEFLSKFAEPFIPLTDYQVLDELERLVSKMNPQRSIIFRANHASNVYSLGGKLPDDRKRLLSLIERLKAHPGLLKPKILRRFRDAKNQSNPLRRHEQYREPLSSALIMAW
jgi:hypothetical protein